MTQAHRKLLNEYSRKDTFKMSNANEINEIALMSLEDKKGEVLVKKRVVCKKNPAVEDDEHLTDLTRLIFNKLQHHKPCCDGGYSQSMKIPLLAIKSIDGINCDAHITIGSRNNRYQFSLRFEAVMVHGRFDNSHVYYHQDFYAQRDFNSVHMMLLKLLDDKIPDLRYYPMLCKFMEKEELEVVQLTEGRLIKNNKIDMYAETCGVCFEPTRAKTGCNHTLCVPCADKIQVLALKDANDYEENSGEPCCPLCRHMDYFHITF